MTTTPETGRELAVEQATENAAGALRVVDGVALPATGTYLLDPTHTRIGFVARHLMVTKVRGHFGQFEGSITIGHDVTGSAAEATIQTASIDTGTPDRDGHLRSPDFLDVERYPQMLFTSTGVEQVDDDVYRVTGDL